MVEHELKCIPGEPTNLYPGPSGTALLIAEGQGKLLNLMSGHIGDGFRLQPTSLLRASPIVDYIFSGDTLLVLREDGLLFSWCASEKVYKKMVQTDFRFVPLKLCELRARRVLFMNQGFLVLNCCSANGCLMIFNVELELIGRLLIRREDFGLSPQLLRESKLIASAISKMNRDVFVGR